MNRCTWHLYLGNNKTDFDIKGKKKKKRGKAYTNDRYVLFTVHYIYCLIFLIYIFK